jgi:hypothetical protein
VALGGVKGCEPFHFLAALTGIVLEPARFNSLHKLHTRQG